MKPLGVVLVTVLVLSSLATIFESQQASALSAPTYTTKTTVTSVNPTFQRVYANGTSNIYFLDSDTLSVFQSNYNVVTGSATSITSRPTVTSNTNNLVTKSTLYDFSNNTNWSQQGTQVTISGGVLNYATLQGGSTSNRQAQVIQLPTMVPDATFTAKSQFNWSARALNPVAVGPILTQNNGWLGDGSSNNAIGVEFTHDGTNGRLAIYTQLGATATISSGSIIVSASTTYYVKLTRTSSTGVQLNVYSDPSYTTNIAGSPISMTVSSSLISLGYLQFSNTYGSGTGNTVTATLDNTIVAYTVGTQSGWTVKTTSDVYNSNIESDKTLWVIGRNATALVNVYVKYDASSLNELIGATQASNYIPKNIVQSTSKLYVPLYDNTVSNGGLRLASSSRVFGLYAETSLYNGTASFPVTNNPMYPVVVNDGASEIVYTAFQYNNTGWKVLKYATQTGTKTLLSTSFVSTIASPQFKFIPLNGEIIVVAGDGTWTINTSTDAVTKVYPQAALTDFVGSLPTGYETWINSPVQSFNMSSSARTFLTKPLFLGSNYEAITYTPSVGGSASRAALYADTVQPGLTSGTISLHRSPSKYYSFPYLSLLVEPSGTTWTIKTVSTTTSLLLDAYHEFTQTVVKDPFQAYEGVSYIYCGAQNYNFTAPSIAFGDVNDCTNWHTFSNTNISTDPIPRSIPWATTGTTVHAFNYTHYTFNIVADNPSNYLITSMFNGKTVDVQNTAISGVAQQSWLYGNCYDVTIQNTSTNSTVVAGKMCANNQFSSTLNLLTLGVPTNATTNGWSYNVTRQFNVGNSGNSTVSFTVDSKPHPYNVKILMTDHYLDQYQTMKKWYNYTGQTGPVTITPSVGDNATLYFIAYDGTTMIPKVTASSFGKQLNLSGFKLALQPMGNVFGVSPFAFFIVLAAAVFVKSNAQIGIIAVGVMAGIFFGAGLIDLTSTMWGVIIAMIALGAIYAGKKVYG